MTDFTMFAVHANLRTLLGGQVQHSGSNHNRANRREYYGAAIAQVFGQRPCFQCEHKEEIDTQIYIFEWFHEAESLLSMDCI
jgi:hypothetical protein